LTEQFPVDENPYAAPQASVVESLPAPCLPDWRAGHLRLLGWLSLLSVFASLVLLLLALGEQALAEEGRRLADWLGLALMLLGNYLLLCLKGFVEARFAARGLAWPVWLMVLGGLLLELLDFLYGAAMFSSFNPQGISYLALMAAYGLATLWFGLRLLRVENVYPALRLLAWLNIAGGLLMASVVLVLLAIVPLLGSSLAMLLVFWRGAAEQRLNAPGAAPGPD
jgi:hypothetical protein